MKIFENSFETRISPIGANQRDFGLDLKNTVWVSREEREGGEVGSQKSRQNTSRAAKNATVHIKKRLADL